MNLLSFPSTLVFIKWARPVPGKESRLNHEQGPTIPFVDIILLKGRPGLDCHGFL